MNSLNLPLHYSFLPGKYERNGSESPKKVESDVNLSDAARQGLLAKRRLPGSANSLFLRYDRE